MKKILQVGSENFGRGGRSVITFELMYEMFQSYQIDFLSTRQIESCLQVDYIESHGGKVQLCVENPKYGRIRREIDRVYKLYSIFSKEQYDLVHINADHAWEVLKTLLVAKLTKTQNIVVHAHATSYSLSSSSWKNKVKNSLILLSRLFINRLNILKLACSSEAAKFMFGSDSDIHIINNGIDMTKYLLVDSDRRHALRKELKIEEDTLVIGTVSRLEPEKNPLFLLDIAQDISKYTSKFIMLIIGDGSLREYFIDIKNEELKNKVLFLGYREDIPQLLQIMDVFVLTSFKEGFGIVNIEAQAAGLPCVVSDGVPATVKVNDNFYFLSLANGPERWAQKILSLRNTRLTNYDVIKERISVAGFSIIDSRKELKKLYEDYFHRNK
ncbi:glycosyltransferase [Streptococcus pneumoniae]